MQLGHHSGKNIPLQSLRPLIGVNVKVVLQTYLIKDCLVNIGLILDCKRITLDGGHKSRVAKLKAIDPAVAHHRLLYVEPCLIHFDVLVFLNDGLSLAFKIKVGPVESVYRIQQHRLVHKR